ncbi:MAG: polysaccharide deacetylase family protein [Rhodospirillales bacterium]|nr:polysaccharide deacetylase family protein [Rhodospirillales bacterium]
MLIHSGRAFAAAEPKPSSVFILSYPNTVDANTLRSHISFFRKSGRDFLSLSALPQFLKGGQGDDVLLTFEDATPQLLRTISPLLIEENIPCTFLISTTRWTDAADRDFLRILLRKSQFQAGIHLDDYQVISDVKRFRQSLNRAFGDFRLITGAPPNIFAFPEGLYTSEMRTVIDRYNFQAVLGQAANQLTGGADPDLPAILPRLDMGIFLEDFESLRRVLSLRPLEVRDATPQATLLETGMPAIGFTIEENIPDKRDLKCYLSDLGEVPYIALTDTRIELRPVLTPDVPQTLRCILRSPYGADTGGLSTAFLLETRTPDEPLSLPE